MTDDERIAKKAHALWEAEGHPHGREQSHWDQAKEMVALEDSPSAALLPRDTGAEEPVEERSIAIDKEGEAPNLTDTGEHDLTSTDREPAVTAPPKLKSAAKAASNRGDAARVSEALVPSGKPKAKGKGKGRGR